MSPQGNVRSVAPARMAAFEVLLKLAQSRSAHSDTLLLSPAVARLGEADRNLTTALVMGVLRWQLALDTRIQTLLSRRARLETPVAAALRLAAFQLLKMDRIPAHAAIHDSVELAKRAGHRFASGMVNAVLRKLAAEAPGAQALEPEAGHPAWLLERWRARFGAEAAAAICGYNQELPPAAVRVPDAARERALEAAGAVLKPGVFLMRARVLEHGMPGAGVLAPEGFRPQDEGSQLIAELAGAGRRVLDCCAAPGGKTAVLAERSPEAEIVACDSSAARLREMREHFRRDPRTARIDTREADARSLHAFGEFDVILCDVPCSGTGTLARNPEIKLRLLAEEIPRQAERQAAILDEAIRHLARGGRLVYSTCSLEREENEAVVHAALAAHPEIAVVPVEQRLGELAAEGALQPQGERRLRESGVDGEFLRTVPGVLRCDGFFAAVLTRRLT